MKSLNNNIRIVNNSLPSAAEVVTDGGLATSRSNQQTYTDQAIAGQLESSPVSITKADGAAPVGNDTGVSSPKSFSPKHSTDFSDSAFESGETHTESNTENCVKTGYIPHWNSLVSLLRPEHPYFADKLGNLNGFYSYTHNEKVDGKTFLYPVMAKHSRENPYHRYLAARSHTGRTMGQLRSVIETNKLKDFRQLDLVVTFPREVSEQLANRNHGINYAWSMYRKLWAELPSILGVDGDLAGMVNLHIWKTETPLNPHFHFHVIVLNYYRAGDGDNKSLVKWFGFEINKTYVNKDGKKRTGPVALSDSQLDAVKEAWTKIVRASCKRNKIECKYLNHTTTDEETVDVEDTDTLTASKSQLLNLYADYVKWETPAKFIHKINYQRRHWIEDYVKFTEKYPDCSNPPEWLEHYSNTVRVFGWWKQLKAFTGDKDLEAEPKIDFNTGEELIYQEHITKFSDIETLPLFCYDCFKGHPVIEALDGNDVAWLKGCFEKDLMDKYGSDDYGPGGVYDV